MRKRNWIVLYDRNEDKVVAYEDLHEGYALCKPDHLKVLGFPLAETAKDAVNYIETILTEEQIKK